MRKHERKNADCRWVNREALWQVFRVYDLRGKLLSGIKSMYVDSSACVTLKGGKSERFRIDSGVR